MSFSKIKERKKDPGMIRPLPPRGSFMDPLRMHPPTSFGLKASIPAPLETLRPDVYDPKAPFKAPRPEVDDGETAAQDMELLPQTVYNPHNVGDNQRVSQAVYSPDKVGNMERFPQTAYDPDDIGNKISNMLAAHEALKGSEAPKLATPTSRGSRYVSKVWNTIKSKSKKISEGNQPEGTRENRLSAALAERPVEDVQRRLNESNNLKSPKIQNVTGNRIPRKPVANGGRSLMTPKSSLAVNEEALLKLESGSITTSVSSDYTRAASSDAMDPFYDETGLEDNLEHRLLKAIPDGASTPRIVVDRRFIVDGDGSPIRKTDFQSYILDHAIPSGSFFSDSDSSAEPGENDSIVDMLVDSPEGLGLDQLALPAAELHVKKHPSPGREWFENLEALMQPQYGRGQPAKDAKYEPDELVQDLATLQALTRRHSDRSMSTQARPIVVREVVIDDDDPSLDIFSFPRGPSRNSRASSRVTRQTCAVQNLRPDDEQADEIDELS